jgi:hypothetical protein
VPTYLWQYLLDAASKDIGRLCEAKAVISRRREELSDGPDDAVETVAILDALLLLDALEASDRILHKSAKAGRVGYR